MKYDEFRIEILPGQDGAYRSRVAQAGGATPEHPFDLPPRLTKDELSDRENSATAGRLGLDRKTELGHRLFQAAFGELGEGCVRMALVENEQRIRQAARNVRRFLDSADKLLHNVIPLAARG